jgi:hypothetical protein
MTIIDCGYSINIIDYLQEHLTSMTINLCKYNQYDDYIFRWIKLSEKDSIRYKDIYNRLT